eukprot:SAG22_NODE_5143_length_1078_cov_1.289070_2_plen_94_part_01
MRKDEEEEETDGYEDGDGDGDEEEIGRLMPMAGNDDCIADGSSLEVSTRATRGRSRACWWRTESRITNLVTMYNTGTRDQNVLTESQPCWAWPL